MKVAHIIPWAAIEAAGTAYSVPRLCQALADQGCDVTLLTIDRKQIENPPGFHHENYPHLAWSWRFWHSPGLRRAIYRAADTVDLMHNHSVFCMPNLYPGVAARKTGVPLVTAPRGVLAPAPLARGRTRKRLFWHLGQKHVLTEARLLQATADIEYNQIRDFGLTQPVAMVPNGVEIPDVSGVGPSSGKRTVLYLARLHPLKGIPLLLEVWRDLPAEKRADWQLKLVGPSEVGHRKELEAFCRQNKLEDVEFTGPLFGAEKLAAYVQADVHVHSSPAENFGMVIAEALAAGTPVICTKGTPWSEVQEHRCGWWIERDHANMTAALSEAISKPRAELDAMGARGREWVARTFGWDAFAKDMVSAYEWVLSGQNSPPPDCVRTQ